MDPPGPLVELAQEMELLIYGNLGAYETALVSCISAARGTPLLSEDAARERSEWINKVKADIGATRTPVATPQAPMEPWR